MDTQPNMFDDDLTAQSHSNPTSFVPPKTTGLAQAAGYGEHPVVDPLTGAQHPPHYVGPQLSSSKQAQELSARDAHDPSNNGPRLEEFRQSNVAPKGAVPSSSRVSSGSLNRPQ